MIELSKIVGEKLIDSTGITEKLKINLIADGNNQVYRITFDDERSGVQKIGETSDHYEALKIYDRAVKEYAVIA